MPSGSVTFSQLCRRAWYRVYRETHPATPWIAPATIRFLAAYLNGRQQMIEWGSGSSTIWLARRVGFLVSIESNGTWYSCIHSKLESAPAGIVDYRHESISDAERARSEWPRGRTSRYVRAVDDFPDRHFDVALVDGDFREACLEVAAKKVRAGGFVVLDNSDWNPDAGWGIPSEWKLLTRRKYSATETSVWLLP